MSDDKYTQRLESLFSNTERVPPDPAQPATPPEAPDVEAMQARMAEMEAEAAEARRQAEEERAQRAAAAADAENLRARMAELEAAAQRRPTTVVESSSQTEPGTVEKTAPRSEMPGVRSHARPTSGWRKTLFGVPALRPQLAEAEKDKVRARNTFRVSLVMFIAAAGMDVYAFYLSFQNGLWQGYVSSGLLLAFALMAGVSAILSRRGRHELGIWLLLGSLALLMPATSTLLAGVGLVLCLALIVETSVFAGITLPPRRASWATIVSVFAGLAALLIDVFGPTDRLALPSTFREVYLPASAALVVAIYGVFLWRQFPNFSLRTKIVLGVILITALSAAAMTYFAYYRTQQSQTFLTDQLQINVSEQAEHELGDTALREARAADRAISDVTADVVALAEYRASLYTQASTLGQGAYWDGHTKITRLPTGQYGNPGADIGSVFIPSTVTLDEALIADLNASAYLDFVAPAILKARANMVALYFINTRSATTYYPNINLASVVPPDFDPTTQPFYTDAAPASNPEHKPVWTAPYQDPAGNGLMVTNAMPVYDQVGAFKGVLAADVLLARMAEQVSAIKVGQSGYAFLIDLAGRIIAMPDAGYKAFGLHPETVPVNETPKLVILGAGPTDLQTVTFRMVAGETGLASVVLEGVENYVAYAPLSSIGYSLGIIVPVAELNAPYLTTRDQIRNDANTTSRQTSILLVVLLAAAVGVSLAMGQFIASPLVRLTETARQITVGNLNAQARVDTEDETGTLARTFNTMTAQLREMLHGLEERVAERTRDLALAAEVGQRVSAVRDLDALLAGAVETIRARFDLYYTQIYLTNPGGTALVLRAGTGAVGQELLRRNHRLPLGPGSINGAAASENRPVLVADTAASGVFRPNPLLPDTRSEVSVPLVVGERVVGVLDLQSTQPGTFTADNLPAFQALAGQLAIAIENADLFATAQQAREAVEAEARRLTRDSWQEFLNAVDRSEHLGFVYDQASLAPLTEPLPPGGEQALTVPIVVTGETVGALQLEAEANRIWTEAEAELVSSVARQVAQQVENLRLLAEAERSRAEAEQATRRLTRESWQDYLEHDTVSAQGYVYDLNQVAPLTPAPQGEATLALTWPLKVQGETIGELAVGELPEKLSDEAAELITAVSEQLSAHIENLRLTEQTGRALAQTEQQAAELRALFAAMPDVVLVYDEQGRYVKIAPTNPSLLYKPPEDMLGKTLTEVLPAPQAEAFMGYIRQVLDTRGTLNIEYSLPIGGQEIWFSATVTPLTANTVFWIARDITERKQAEETLRRQHAYQGALQEITLGLIGRLELTDLLQNIITRAGELIGTTHGYIFLLEPDEAEMRMHVGTGTYNSFMDYRLKPGQAVVGTIWQTGEPLVIDDYQAWANRLHLKNLEAVRAVVGAPLKSGSQVVGVIGLAYLEEGRRFGEDEVAVLSRFAQLASVALDNARLYAEAQQELTERKRAEAILDKRATELQTVAKVSTAASTILEARILLQNVVDLTKDNFGLYHTHIYLVDQPTGMLVLTAGAGEVGRRMVSEGRSIALNRMQSLVARAAREREAVIVNDVRAAPDFLPHPLLPDTRSEMAVPMIAGDQLLGVFDVQHDQPGYFTEEDVRIQTALAAQVAVALQNANLYAEQAAIVTRLRELDHLKSTFLANMSHELRTPLNSILGFTDVMLEGLDGPLTDLMESDLKVVQKNGKHLLNLINDVLDMAKIEAGKMSLSLERFNLQEVLEEVVEIIGPLARDKALDLRIATEPTDALDLTADRIRLRQVMINLVGNAIKFTEQGVITLQAKQHNGSVRVAIRDTGFGIPPDKLEAIFEAFSQVDTSTTRKAGGTGLGLPISRRLIELHGGRLWAESSGIPGEGSTFFVELPLEVQEVAV